MIYLYPRLEVIGKRPVWSVNILREHSVTLRKSWCVWSVRISGGDCWVIMGTSCCILVDCLPLYCCLMCHLVFASVLGRYLLTSSTVSPDQDAKAFLLIASTKVILTHVSLVLVPCCIPISSLSDKRPLCVSLFLILLALKGCCFSHNHKLSWCTCSRDWRR